MKDNSEENPTPASELKKAGSSSPNENKDMLEFTYLINMILDYYQEDEPFEGEDWKKDSGLLSKPIPDEVDVEVKKAFISQLKKFQ